MRSCALACCAVLLFLLSAVALRPVDADADADEDAAAPAGIAWFDDLRAARRTASETGRPLFIALHRLPRAASPQAAARFRAWIDVYQDAGVVEASRPFVCARRLIQAQEGLDPDAGRAPAVTHLVLDAGQQVLLREDAIRPAVAPAGAEALTTFLRRGLAAFGPVPDDAPTVDTGASTRTRPTDGSSSLRPVRLPLDAPGVRLRLRWDLPAPTLAASDGGADRVEARVSMRWDGVGPFALGSIAFGAGEDVDVPIDLRFEAVEDLAPHLTTGTHRVDLYLEPEAGTYPFSRGPLHVGRVWIDFGEGGGGGGGGADAPQPEEPQPPDPETPPPVPEGEEEEPEPPPPSNRTEVVEPFVREGDTVEKEDAVVAVEDPDGAVKPPRRVPLEEALREFEKMKERAVSEERIAPRDRDFVRLYFDALERAVRGGRRGGGR